MKVQINPELYVGEPDFLVRGLKPGSLVLYEEEPCLVIKKGGCCASLVELRSGKALNDSTNFKVKLVKLYE